MKKSSKHSGHCSQTRAKVLAEHTEKEKAVRLANKERKRAAKEADRIAKKKAKAVAKKLVKDVVPEIPANNSTQTVNIVMNGPITVQVMGESSAATETLDQVLTNFKALPHPAENAHIVVTQQEVETPLKHTSEDDTPQETEDVYDPNDDHQWDEDAVFIIDDSDDENTGDDSDDDIITDDYSDDDTILVEKFYECIKVEDSDSDDDEIELLEIVSAKEDTPPTVSKSRK